MECVPAALARSVFPEKRALSARRVRPSSSSVALGPHDHAIGMRTTVGDINQMFGNAPGLERAASADVDRPGSELRKPSPILAESADAPHPPLAFDGRRKHLRAPRAAPVARQTRRRRALG